MGFNIQTGTVGIGRQSVAGGNVAVQTYFKVLSGGMGVDRELIVPDPEIGGGRDIDEGIIYPGSVGASGTYEFIVRPNAIGHFLLGVLGACSSLPLSGVAYTHEFTPANTLDWFTIMERISTTYETFQVTDCKINSLDLTCTANDYLKGSAGVLGNIPTSDVSVTGESYEDTSPFLYAGATITIGPDVFLPTEVGVNFNNNIDDSDYRVGSLYRGDLTEKRRELVLTATIRPDDSDLFKQAVWGSSSVSAPANTKTNIAVNYKWASYESIGSTAYKYSLEIDVPVAVISPFKIEPSGDDTLEHAIEIRAAKGASDLVTITLQNSAADYAV